MLNCAWLRCAALAALLLNGCGRVETKLAVESWQGVVEFQEVAIAFEVGGRLTKLSVVAGSKIELGQEIATLDDTLERAARVAQESEAQAATARAELVKVGPRPERIAAVAARRRAAGVTVKRLETDLARERALLSAGVTPRVKVDNLESQFQRAKAEYEAITQDLARVRKGPRKQEVVGVEAQAEARSAALLLSDRRIERYTLRSPLQGDVLERHVEPGEIVAPGTPIITVANTQSPLVDIFVPQGAISRVVLGGSVQVKVDALDSSLTGTVEHISRKTEFTPRFLFSEKERSNLVVRVRIRVDDPKRVMRAGVPAFVRLDTDDLRQPSP